MAMGHMVLKACSLHNGKGGSSPRGLRPHMAMGHVVPKACILHNGEGSLSP